MCSILFQNENSIWVWLDFDWFIEFFNSGPACLNRSLRCPRVSRGNVWRHRSTRTASWPSPRPEATHQHPPSIRLEQWFSTMVSQHICMLQFSCSVAPNNSKTLTLSFWCSQFGTFFRQTVVWIFKLCRQVFILKMCVAA